MYKGVNTISHMLVGFEILGVPPIWKQQLGHQLRNRVRLLFWGMSEVTRGWSVGTPANRAGFLDSASGSPERMGSHTGSQC